MADPIVFERVIDASVDEAFALFTQPERLRRWQAVSAAVDLTVGGDYRLTVVPGSIVQGVFSEIEPGRRLVYTWGWQNEGAPPQQTSTISVEFEPLGDKTKVTLTHAGLDEETAASHEVGWNHFLARLEHAASIGDAGLNPWGLDGDELDLLSSAEATWAICSDVMSRFRPEDRDKPTPCEGFTVHGLVEHLLESMRLLGAGAGAVIPETIIAESAEDYIAQAVEPTLTAWRERGTDGMVPFRDSEAPATLLAGILSLEFLIHAWDFAQATGHSAGAPDGLVGYVQAVAEKIIQPGNRGEGKGFAAAVETSSPDPLTALAAFSGRDPGQESALDADAGSRSTSVHSTMVDYDAARAELRSAEAALMQQRETVAALRRTLPLGPAADEYHFDTQGGTVTLRDLFTDDDRPLILYHFMFGGSMAEPCPMCSMWADGWNAVARHLGRRVDLALVTQASEEANVALAAERGWQNLSWLSGANTTFKADYGSEDSAGNQQPFFTVFEMYDGQPHLSWSGGAHIEGEHWRGVDLLSPVWHFFDLTRNGRGDFMPNLGPEMG